MQIVYRLLFSITAIQYFISWRKFRPVWCSGWSRCSTAQEGNGFAISATVHCFPPYKLLYWHAPCKLCLLHYKKDLLLSTTYVGDQMWLNLFILEISVWKFFFRFICVLSIFCFNSGFQSTPVLLLLLFSIPDAISLFCSECKMSGVGGWVTADLNHTCPKCLQGMKAQGVTEDKLQLLNDISGSFRPGVLTALVGVSGAGKTTFMDVLAGRKTGGYIEGSIYISGYPKKQETFARVSGYCEQFDIHSPNVTVHESLLYSAWLRLSKDVSREVRRVIWHMLSWLYFDLLTLLFLIEYCVPLYKVVTQAHDPVDKLMLLWNLISSTNTQTSRELH